MFSKERWFIVPILDIVLVFGYIALSKAFACDTWPRKFRGAFIERRKMEIIRTDPRKVVRYLKGKRVHINFTSQPETVYKRRIRSLEIPAQSEYSYATVDCYLDEPLGEYGTQGFIRMFVEPERFDWVKGIFHSDETRRNVLMKTDRWVRQNRPRPWRWKLYLIKLRLKKLLGRFSCITSC